MLTYKNSFIDVEEVANAGAVQRRSSSLPPTESPKRFFDLESMDCEEEEEFFQTYVESLEPKLQAFEEERALARAHVTGSVDSSEAATGSEAVTLVEPEPEPVEPELPGSVGHPELCRKPCIYFNLGQCSNGDACTYCHLPHSHKVPKLDKKQREMLRTMNSADFFALILKVAESKLQDLGTEAAGDVLALLCRSANGADHEAVSDKAMRPLRKTLAHMTLSAQLGLAIHRQAKVEGPSLAVALERLRQSM